MMRAVAKIHSKKLAVIATGLAGALCFNNWLLGPWLNGRLFSANGSVSELSAVTQPHHDVFRLLDILAGLLFIGLAWLLAGNSTQGTRWRRLILIGLASLGAANIFDAAFSLKCSETLDKACQIPVSLSPAHFQLPSHAYSSVIIALCYLLLPLAGFFHAQAKRAKLLAVVSALAVMMALLAFAAAVSGYLDQHSLSVRTSGAGQEIQMLLLGFWIVVFAFTEVTQARFSLPSDKRKV